MEERDGDTIPALRADVVRIKVQRDNALLFMERYMKVLQDMRDRDERNGSLPAAYRAMIDEALGTSQ